MDNFTSLCDLEKNSSLQSKVQNMADETEEPTLHDPVKTVSGDVAISLDVEKGEKCRSDKTLSDEHGIVDLVENDDLEVDGVTEKEEEGYKNDEVHFFISPELTNNPNDKVTGITDTLDDKGIDPSEENNSVDQFLQESTSDTNLIDRQALSSEENPDDKDTGITDTTDDKEIDLFEENHSVDQFLHESISDTNLIDHQEFPSQDLPVGISRKSSLTDKKHSENEMMQEVLLNSHDADLDPKQDVCDVETEAETHTKEIRDEIKVSEVTADFTITRDSKFEFLVSTDSDKDILNATPPSINDSNPESDQDLRSKLNDMSIIDLSSLENSENKSVSPQMQVKEPVQNVVPTVAITPGNKVDTHKTGSANQSHYAGATMVPPTPHLQLKRKKSKWNKFADFVTLGLATKIRTSKTAIPRNVMSPPPYGTPISQTPLSSSSKQSTTQAYSQIQGSVSKPIQALGKSSDSSQALGKSSDSSQALDRSLVSGNRFKLGLMPPKPKAPNQKDERGSNWLETYGHRLYQTPQRPTDAEHE